MKSRKLNNKSNLIIKSSIKLIKCGYKNFQSIKLFDIL